MPDIETNRRDAPQDVPSSKPKQPDELAAKHAGQRQELRDREEWDRKCEAMSTQALQKEVAELQQMIVTFETRLRRYEKGTQGYERIQKELAALREERKITAEAWAKKSGAMRDDVPAAFEKQGGQVANPKEKADLLQTALDLEPAAALRARDVSKPATAAQSIEDARLLCRAFLSLQTGKADSTLKLDAVKTDLRGRVEAIAHSFAKAWFETAGFRRKTDLAPLEGFKNANVLYQIMKTMDVGTAPPQPLILPKPPLPAGVTTLDKMIQFIARES